VWDRKFYRDVRKWVVTLGSFRRTILFISTILLPALIGVLSAVGSAAPDWKPVAVPIQIAVILFALAIGVVLFIFDQSPVDLFQKLALEIQRSTDLEENDARLRAEVVQLSSHVNSLSVAARAVESVFLEPAPDRDGIISVVGQLVGTMADNRVSLFGVRDHENWNFAVYVREGSVLRSLHCRRNFEVAAGGHRVWPVGQGHVGLAFQRNGELVTDDVAAHEVFHAAGDLHREYDNTSYRGVASIPIPDVTNSSAVGVLVATSSVVGRFNQTNVQPLRDLAQSIGAILSQIRDGNVETGGSES
jgi:hypothetical protein